MERHSTYPEDVAKLKKRGTLDQFRELRPVKYPTNLIE
jgi:hypothetical protein